MALVVSGMGHVVAVVVVVLMFFAVVLNKNKNISLLKIGFVQPTKRQTEGINKIKTGLKISV